MIDLHCHLLPGIDDGPESLAESLALARLGVRTGIRHAIVTPHIVPGCWDNTRTSIRTAFEHFRTELNRNGIALQLGMAAEVRASKEMLGLLSEGSIPFLGHWGARDVLLLEFPHENIPRDSEKLVSRLLQQQIVPLIAHPERNKAILRDLRRVTPYIEMGCLLQVTAGSLVGQFGLDAQQRAFQMIETGWVTVLASDAHNLKFRPPNLLAGRRAVARVFGESVARKLVVEMPARLLGLPF